ncbi:amidohydrolase family protein [Burkholderia metallica]|uniref:amidohydrolase family protein n=1 Tax=Burkholderia metallica TaxID=488729 RepID=UPI001575F05A|nr:amidohydrolase family protein [Burkholderia metallica]NTZ04887.1 amidohydrolase [Burkholderia metallica]
MQVVDPHVHFWDADALSYGWLDRARPAFSGAVADLPRRYRPADLRADAGADIDVLKVVHVEAIHDAWTTPSEVDWLQALADAPASGGMPDGIVAGVDLFAPDARIRLAGAAAHPNVRGIRQVLNRHPDPWYNYVDVDYLAEPRWRENFGMLSEFGLSFDLQLYPSQVGAALVVIDAHPDTPVIVNHTGMFVDRASVHGWREWRDGLRGLARRANVTMKLSGLAMFDHRWTVESFRPYVLEAIDVFGAARCMFASNFPVDRLHAGYRALWHAYAAIVAGAGDEERDALFVHNAMRTYRL